MSSPPQTGTSVQAPSSSATIRGNAAAAASATSGGKASCDFCARVGLPILPLRYAVVPAYVPGAVVSPVGWAHLGDGLKSQPAQGLQGHRYALRTLRKGYVMVYFGSGLWHAYVVSADGLLRKLADIDDPDFKNDREMSDACKRAGHNVPASFITIPPITNGGKRMLPTKVWIAFSDVLWTHDVRKQYEQGGGAATAARAQRMQAFMVDQIGKQADTVPDAFQLPQDEAATAQRLNGLVVEYATDAAQAGERTQYDAIDTFDPKKRNHVAWQSVHGISMRTGQAAAVAKYATKLTDKLMPSAVVLNDPVGMVQELNATRLAQLENRQRYLSHEKIARPLLISQSIMGLKQLFGEQTMAAVTQEEAKKGLPDVQTETMVIAGEFGPAQILTSTSTRKERVDAQTRKLWDSLQEHYREADRAAFEKTVTTTLKSFQDWLVKTDADYAWWLAKQDWIDRRHDYDSAVPEHTALLIASKELSLRGGPTSTPANPPSSQAPQDTRVYEVWKKFFAMKPNDPGNPIHVALFGNDEEILEYLLPEGPNPFTDKLHKGSKLYKVIKTIIGTKELTSNTLSGLQQKGFSGALTRDAANKVPNPVRVAGADALNYLRQAKYSKAAGAFVSRSILTVGGTLNRMAVDAVSEVGEATVMRAIQGAVLLYDRREVYLVASRMRVRDYLAYLNDIAFKTQQAGVAAAALGVRSVAQAGKNTVRSMAIAGALTLGDKKVANSVIDVLAWAYDDLDGVTKSVDTLSAEQQTARTARDAAQAARVAESEAAAAMQVHPLTISPEAEAFLQKVTARAASAKAGASTVVEAMTRNSLRLASTGSGILAVASLVIQGWSLKDNIKKANATFIGSNEARVLVVSGSVAVVGAVFEVAGVTGKLIGASWGTLIGRVGGVIGAVASILEGVQAGLAAVRAASHGDTDAKWLYIGAATSLVIGGAVGIYGAATGAALLGPVGWALLLIAAGVALLYFALNAEDSQAAIWLDRCYWGKGARYKSSENAAEMPWTDKQVDDELSNLNAIIVGLSGQTGFNDDGWGFADWVWDTVKAKLTFPNFDSQDSAFEWSLRAVNAQQALSITIAGGKYQTVPDDPNSVTVRASATKKTVDTSQYIRNLVGPTLRKEGRNQDVMVMEVSAEVRVKYFKDVVLMAEYVPVKSDPRGRASLSLSEKD